jgi:hypothetical protein
MSANRTTTKTTAVRKTAPARKAAAKPTPAPPPEIPRTITDPEVVSRVVLGDNREVRITRVKTGTGTDLVRVGIVLLPSGENMSGAVFPETYVDEVIAALRKVHA